MSTTFMSGDMREPLVVIRKPSEDAFYMPVMESAEDREFRKIEAFAASQTRALAMTAVLEWVYGMDYKFDHIANMVLESADEDSEETEEDEDAELTDDEEEYADELMESVAEAMVFLGAGPTAVKEFLRDGNDKIGESVGNMLMDNLDSEPDSDDALISRFAVLEGAVLESLEVKVRDGEKIFKKKRRKKMRQTSAQKAQSKINIKKAHTGAAKHKREKSMKMRKRMGLD